MKYARIINNAAVDTRDTSPAGCFTDNLVAEFVEVPDTVQDGWILADGVWGEPPPPPEPVPYVPEPQPPAIPQFVTMRQARLALHAAGLLSSVNAAIASMDEPAKTAALIDWEYASVVERNAGLVPAMAAALGMSDADIDDLFITAATL